MHHTIPIPQGPKTQTRSLAAISLSFWSGVSFGIPHTLLSILSDHNWATIQRLQGPSPTSLPAPCHLMYVVTPSCKSLEFPLTHGTWPWGLLTSPWLEEFTPFILTICSLLLPWTASAHRPPVSGNPQPPCNRGQNVRTELYPLNPWHNSLPRAGAQY